jgi:ATP-dependent Zn protease
LCRLAEELIYGTENVTTGASNDFMQVSRVARQMVERFGFSKKIGQLSIGGGGGNPFLGQQVLLYIQSITGHPMLQVSFVLCIHCSPKPALVNFKM